MSTKSTVSEAETEIGTSQPSQSARDKKSRPIKSLPTDRIKFAKQLDLLRAYAAASGLGAKPVSNSEVARLMQMKASTVSLANAFFADVGFLSKSESGYTPAPEVVGYARAFEWNPETAAYKLSPLLERSWFMQALLPRLRFRSLRLDEAIATLAESASAGPEYKGQLETLLDYLATAGLIVRENGDVRLMKSTSTTQPDVPSDDAPQSKPSEGRETPAPRSSLTQLGMVSSANGVVQFHISVKVDMTEFAGWDADRISAFFAGIAQVLAAKRGVSDSEIPE